MQTPFFGRPEVQDKVSHSFAEDQRILLGSCLLQKRPTLSGRASFTDGGGISAWGRSFCSSTTTLLYSKGKSSSKRCSVPVYSPFLRKDCRLSTLVHVGRNSTVSTTGSGCWFSVKLQILETFNGFCIHIVLNICTFLLHELTFKFGNFCKRPPSFHPWCHRRKGRHFLS